MHSAASGTHAGTGAEATLATIADPGVYQLQVDTADMGNNDALRLRIEVKVTSGGARRQIYDVPYLHGQGDLVKVSVPTPSLHEIAFFITATAGASIPWEVVAL